LALPLWEKAVRSVRLDAGNEPVVIADYGSSQGKNSLVPMQVAVKVLRERLGADRAISVFHVDQPSNDFNTLFEVLAADPERYGLNDLNVFPGAIGRSFYELGLPGIRASRVVLLCGCVAQPHPGIDSWAHRFFPRRGCSAGGV
jgi:hypothetical protein